MAPAGTRSIWPWELTPLTARAIGAWGLGGALFLALIAREADWVRVRGAMLSFAAFGVLQLVAVARYPGAVDWSGAGAWIAASLAGAIGMGVVGVLMANRAAAPAG